MQDTFTFVNHHKKNTKDWPLPQIGDVVAGCRIQHRIATGGMGVVYEAVHEQIGQRYAIKFLRREFAGCTRALARFQLEARLLAEMAHENIVAVYEFGRFQGRTPFIVMEFLLGRTLRAVLDEELRLDATMALELIRQVCQAMAYVHGRGVVHRDLKPENLMVMRSKDGALKLKVFDFGIAKAGPLDSQVTSSGATLGTSHYMSPEQALGESEVTAATDVYSLGVILYELLSGYRPHPGGTYGEVLFHLLTRPPVPLESRLLACPLPILDVVNRCLRDHHFERPKDAEQLLLMLEACTVETMIRTSSGTRSSQTHISKAVCVSLQVAAGALWGVAFSIASNFLPVSTSAGTLRPDSPQLITSHVNPFLTTARQQESSHPTFRAAVREVSDCLSPRSIRPPQQSHGKSSRATRPRTSHAPKGCMSASVATCGEDGFRSRTECSLAAHQIR